MLRFYNDHSVRFLTLIVIFFTFPFLVWAKVSIENQNFNTYNRMNIFIDRKELIQIQKASNIIHIKSLDDDLLSDLYKKLNNKSYDSKYIKGIELEDNIKSDTVATKVIKILLTSEYVEVFIFFKDSERKYVLDFWQSEIVKKNISLKKQNSNNSIIKPKINKNSRSISSIAKKVIPNKKIIKVVPKVKLYRDFRYGAAFVWDYSPYAPKFRNLLNLDSKTPEYYYPIKNRKYEDNDKEAHLQLSINLFRKKKWGLMYKSLKLYKDKYKEDQNSEYIEYLKANAILRNNFKAQDKSAVKMANNMLHNIADLTDDYELKKGILKYFSSYYIKFNNSIEGLKNAKKLYVITKTNFDIEESSLALKFIFYNLSKLNQIDSINQLTEEKTVQKLLSKQDLIGYKTYVLLKLKKSEEIIKLYEKNKKTFVGVLHPMLLYNVAEAYFRNADYEKALKLYDKFASDYSYDVHASKARLRIALGYELLDKNIDQTLELYRNAINRSQQDKIGYEARLRYVALRSIRKIKITEKDREVRVFIEGLDKKVISKDKNLKKLLWLVRMRSYIADKNWRHALTYLNALPLNSMSPEYVKVFEADGADVVYGIMLYNFKKADYSRVVRFWEIYKNKYINKVAMDSYLNFITCKSLLKLGLHKAFDDNYERFYKLRGMPEKSYPSWSEITKLPNKELLLNELQLIKNIDLENWDLVNKNIATILKRFPKYENIEFYRGFLQFKNKKYSNSVKHFERFLSRTNKIPMDVNDIAELINMYTEAIYKTGNIDKFKKTAHALLVDTDKVGSENEYMTRVKQRLGYLLIETMVGDDKKMFDLEMESIRFLKVYPESIYKARISYLLGSILVSNGKIEEGKKVLNKIIKDNVSAVHIKELAQLELSLLNLRDKI